MTVDSSASDLSDDLAEIDSDPAPPAIQATDHQTIDATRPFFLISIAFLVLSLLIGVIAATQVLAPNLLSEFAYGLSHPIATNLFLYGWLTIGLAGAVIHVVADNAGRRVASPQLARLGAVLLAAGVVAGSVAIALGLTEGRRYLEYPLWADVPILVGMFLVSVVLGRTLQDPTEDGGPVRWYGRAAVWWFMLAFVTGNIPGLTGVAGAYQTAFFRASMIGLWLGSAGVAILYHVVPRVSGRRTFLPTRLTVLGFWSLAFVWALTAPVDLVYSPAPDWLGTVGALFSIALLIPPAVIFADIVLSMRLRWSLVHGNVPIRFMLLGGAFFAAWPVFNLGMAFRSSSGIVQFTDWVAGMEQIGFYGIFTAWLVGYMYFAGADLVVRGTSENLGRLHFVAVIIGLGLWSAGSFLAGVNAGWTWIASANEGVANTGVGFFNTLAAVEDLYVIRYVGFVVFVIAMLAFVANVLGGRPVERIRRIVVTLDDDPGPELVATQPITRRKLRWGSIGLFLAAVVLVVVVPALETGGAEATALADITRNYSDGDAAAGRDIYVAQGCWYCHTQQVRQIVTDVGLGPVSQAGDYVYETPVLFGVQRIGPDLMHFGSRVAGIIEPADVDAAAALTVDELRGWIVEYLADPQGKRPYSNMPAYDHLSSRDLERLAAYLEGLK